MNYPYFEGSSLQLEPTLEKVETHCCASLLLKKRYQITRLQVFPNKGLSGYKPEPERSFLLPLFCAAPGL